MDKSKGVYRIPYEDSTVVKVTRDHKTHKPIGRIDMVGTDGGKPYKIVAAADGHIRFIVDRFSEQVDSSSGEPCTNNYVWIEHADGEWTKYSHLKKDSTTKTAKLKAGQFINAGTFLGFEDKVGCASGSHLHFEVGVPQAGDPITATGGYLKDNKDSKRNRIPRICGISGGIFVAGETYTARSVPGNISSGSAEVARHGVPVQDYQCLFDQAVNSNYKLEWIDGFSSSGGIFFNVIFRPSDGNKWSAFHNLTGARYQAQFNKFTGQGYRLTHIKSYTRGNRVLYAAIFVADGGPQFMAYHGISAAEHQKRFNESARGGWRPKNISVVSINGNRSYAALYERSNVGSYMARSFLTPNEYQKEFDDNRTDGRQLAYLTSYQHNGEPRFSAIWNSATNGAFKARHGLTGAQYQHEWEDALSKGLLTRAVTAYQQGSGTRYAALWRK